MVNGSINVHNILCQSLHVTPGPIALNVTESGDGVIVHLESADIESHDPARIQALHQLQVVHNTTEVS